MWPTRARQITEREKLPVLSTQGTFAINVNKVEKI